MTSRIHFRGHSTYNRATDSPLFTHVPLFFHRMQECLRTSLSREVNKNDPITTCLMQLINGILEAKRIFYKLALFSGTLTAGHRYSANSVEIRHVTSNLFFFFDETRYKPACSVTDTNYGLEISDMQR